MPQSGPAPRTTTPRPARALRRVAAAVLALAGAGAAVALPAEARAVNAEVVTGTQAGGKAVALTFDDGPNGADTLRLLDVLRENHVKATFCVVGDQVLEYPDVVRRIVAEGHTLCNHTLHHDNVADWTPEQVRADLEATNAVIRSVVPKARIPYFRAPFGAWGASPQVAADLGMQPLGWQSLIFDWDPAPAPDVLAQNLRDAIQPRAVVLAHDGPANRSGTVDAVATVIPEFKAKGWHFTQPAHRG
ncbi:chitooligosaccharide deacetylase NodB [Kineococcus sp. NUM-3379]